MACRFFGSFTIRTLVDLIEPSLHGMGFELVQVRLLGQTRKTLQVMAEPSDPKRLMTVEDCADISRAISAVLDVHDPIPGAYNLEVSSPGIDRPLVRLRDYARFKGHLAKIEVEPDLEGRKRFKAVIENVEGEDVLIVEDGRTFRVPFASIRKARLVLTDELIAAVQAAQAETEEASPVGGV
ncbi:MAG TPA: ribosome maturation factor RimP [Geminicoccus sp.]|uniref:ribosome maturation factor RimP n=1 Tax=Geminicoccus sp. TaxID=2024832 RepID=UPI002E34010B|nr:ribosome maturation factor RimP [Geminicoccus sp.]HEX2526256.1 ribosome maturation factor RimP [Geminicoccus sp.]